MNMPSFTAEASLYRTSNRYLSAVGGSFPSGGYTVVNLQGCGVWDTIKCGVFVAAGITGCSLLCVGAIAAGPAAIAACVGCWAAVFPADLFISCRDCIPGWVRDIINIFESGGGGGGSGGGGGGGTGGGGGQCGCPRSRPKCCGGCVKEPGMPLFCDGECVPRTAQCP